MVKQIFMSVFLFKKAFIKFYDLLIKSCPYKILHIRHLQNWEKLCLSGTHTKKHISQCGMYHNIDNRSHILNRHYLPNANFAICMLIVQHINYQYISDSLLCNLVTNAFEKLLLYSTKSSEKISLAHKVFPICP